MSGQLPVFPLRIGTQKGVYLAISTNLIKHKAVRFGPTKRSGWHKEWSKMGQIRGFFRSGFSAFGANALKPDLKKPRICPIWGQSDPPKLDQAPLKLNQAPQKMES